MGSRRFDTFARNLHLLLDRREGFRLLLPALIAGGVSSAIPSTALACKSKGRPCTEHDQCCSGGCTNKKKVKKKNGEPKKEKVGKCACSLSQEQCNASSDCCASDTGACGFNSCGGSGVCCVAAGFPCGSDCDCCFPNKCLGGICAALLDCSDTEEECNTTDDCCFEEDICASNGCVPGTVCCGDAGAPCEAGGDGCDCCSQFECGQIAPGCEPDGEAQCCAPGSGQCEDDCDCCTPMTCDPTSKLCVNPICLPTQAACTIGGDRESRGIMGLECCDPYVCSTVVCNGEIVVTCCHQLGSGTCTDDCDCCGTLRCIDDECKLPVQ
jgi:hypothetical protein